MVVFFFLVEVVAARLFAGAAMDGFADGRGDVGMSSIRLKASLSGRDKEGGSRSGGSAD